MSTPGAPTVFPRPREVTWLSGTLPADTSVQELVSAELPPQGYRLRVTDGIELWHADDAGRRYGRQTLEQLGVGADRIARCDITDHPDIPVRGYMLDISRDRVPTRETLATLVERLGAMRVNHLQLYTEHTFAYRDHEAVWRDASPLTPDDVAWLEERCGAHGIELAANQNTFGHLERWLEHDAYRSRAEVPDGWTIEGRWHPPRALAPTEDNAAFALDLVREITAAFTSRRVNIGCDEVWELGLGRSAEEVARRGAADVFVEHVRRIAEPLLAEGLEVHFWSDMVDQDPAAARALAEAGAVAGVWGYEAPLGRDPDAVDVEALPKRVRDEARAYLSSEAAMGFEPRLRRVVDAGFSPWVVPGTSGWGSFIGRHGNARGNLLDAVESALAHGAGGVLITEWGDFGHHHPPFMTLPALAYGAATAWCRASNGDLDDQAVADAVNRLVGDPSHRFGGALVRLGRVDEALGLHELNGTQFFSAIVDTILPSVTDPPRPEAYTRALSEIETARDELAASRPGVDDGRVLVRESRQAAALAHHGIQRLAAAHDLELAPDGRTLRRDFDALLDEQRACWRRRSRPGGLEDSLGRLRPPA